MMTKSRNNLQQTKLSSCVKAKAQFEKMKVPTTQNIGTDIPIPELFGILSKKVYSQLRTVSQIFIGDTYIGGYEAGSYRGHWL